MGSATARKSNAQKQRGAEGGRRGEGETDVEAVEAGRGHTPGEEAEGEEEEEEDVANDAGEGEERRSWRVLIMICLVRSSGKESHTRGSWCCM